MRTDSSMQAEPRQRPRVIAVLPLVILLSLAALPLLAACGQNEPAEQPALRMIGNENMGFLMQTQGGAAGFSADLAAYIAKRMGRTLTVTLSLIHI